MSINWDIVLKIAVPLGTLVTGKYLDSWLERRARLLIYLGHASVFTVKTNPNPTIVHTHAIVIRNAGRKATTNVRLGHYVLPENVHIFPPVNHEITRNPDGSGEIVLPTLVPGEEVTISYLYFPPLLWSQIHSYTKSDDGLARTLNMLPTPQPPKWVIKLAQALILIGTVSTLYILISLGIRFGRHLASW